MEAGLREGLSKCTDWEDPHSKKVPGRRDRTPKNTLLQGRLQLSRLPSDALPMIDQELISAS
ncbi:hypothetical protein HYDPIDRAFT_35020 [Hydnomerulius pinastri MD-312]|uniref:Uncharacterized protein n=1 Tax=Hydnomerulius pinastri MD-312 TaxID=994086 RepID=A0A0C2PWP1_9AGAM|nr:hypothetical protein HYDPIDRAFT_35020 [Hydnomerulius pinastri MD-312]